MSEYKDKSKTPHYKVDNNLDKNKNIDALNPIVKEITDMWDDWDEYWSTRLSDFEKYYDRWIGKAPKRDEDWQSAFHKRLTWQAEKTLVARYHSALFPVSAPIEAEAVEVNDEMQRILAKSLVGHWFKLGKFTKEFLSTMRSAAIFGTGLFEDDWYVRKEQITERTEKQIPDFRALVDVNGEKVLDEYGNIKAEQVGYKTISQEEKRLKVVEDRYRIRKANIFAWRVHPYKIDDDDDYPVIKQEFITYDDLLERQAEAEKYGYTKFDNMGLVEQDKTKSKEEDLKRLQKDGEYIDDDNPRIEILHYWGLYSDESIDNKGKKSYSDKKPMWIMVANRKHILKKQENPYWHKKPPLFHIVWTEDEKPSYYGIGLAQIGGDSEDRANVNVNIRTDVKKKSIRGSGWYNAMDKKIKKSQLQSNLPGLMRACSDVNNAVKYDLPPGVAPEDYKEEEVAVNDHREITGATTSLLPTADVGQQHKTLGGMEIMVSQGMQRLKPDLSMMEVMGIRKIANRAFLLTRQFMTKNETIRLIASESQLKQFNLTKIYTMTPKELMGGMHFFCTGLSESIDKAQNIDKLLKYAEMTSKVPAMQAVTNYQAIAKRVALWLGFEDVDEFVQSVNNMQIPIAQAQPQGLPPGMPGQPPMPLPNQQPMMNRPLMPMAPPQGMPPQMQPGGNGNRLPPQILQMIMQNMMQKQMRGGR